MGEPRWSVVVPVKPLTSAKTRLRAGVPAPVHRRLVLAMAEDTVAAVLACPVVAGALVVTDDAMLAGSLRRLGAAVVPDRPAAGLNHAVGYGARVAARPGRWIAVVGADLPALRPTDLAGVLLAAARHRRRRFLRDAGGSGTALLTSPPGVALDPRFGPESAARHAASGAWALSGDWPSVRHDVDTLADLAAAARLGLGPRTRAVRPLLAG